MPPKARLGMTGYAKALGHLKEPKTIMELSEAMDVTVDTAVRLVTHMHERGYLHIDSWRVAPKKKTVPRYRYGSDVDAERPALTAGGRPVTSPPPKKADKPAPEVIAFCRLLDCMQEPCTEREMRNQTGIHRDTIKKTLRELRANYIVRVEKWVPRANGIGGAHIPMWILGGGPSAKKESRRKLSQEAQRRYRARKRIRDGFQTKSLAPLGVSSVFSWRPE